MTKNKKQKKGAREWSTASFNIDTGCATGCYEQMGGCWACKLAIQHKQVKDYAEWIHPRPQGKKSYHPHNEVVMFPSTHNIDKTNLPRYLVELEKLLEFDNKVLIVEKPWKDIIRQILDHLAGRGCEDRVEFRFSVTCASDAVWQRYEPKAPSPQERVDCLKMVLDARFPASVSMEPYLESPGNMAIFICKTLRPGEWARGLSLLREGWVGPLNYECPPELAPLYTPENLQSVVDAFKRYPNFFFKDHVQKALKVDARGNVIPTPSK